MITTKTIKHHPKKICFEDLDGIIHCMWVETLAPYLSRAEMGQVYRVTTRTSLLGPKTICRAEELSLSLRERPMEWNEQQILIRAFIFKLIGIKHDGTTVSWKCEQAWCSSEAQTFILQGMLIFAINFEKHLFGVSRYSFCF